MPRPTLATGRKTTTRKTVADKIADKSSQVPALPLASTSNN